MDQYSKSMLQNIPNITYVGNDSFKLDNAYFDAFIFDDNSDGKYDRARVLLYEFIYPYDSSANDYTCINIEKYLNGEYNYHIPHINLDDKPVLCAVDSESRILYYKHTYNVINVELVSCTDKTITIRRALNAMAETYTAGIPYLNGTINDISGLSSLLNRQIICVIDERYSSVLYYKLLR